MDRRCSSLNQAMHWITARCMFAILPLAWVMTNLKPEAAYREDLFNWHMTIGVIVLLITAFRVIWRVVDGPPPYPPPVSIWEQRLAHAADWIFFLTLFWMPITGFLTSYAGGQRIKLFDLIPTPDFFSARRGARRLF